MEPNDVPLSGTDTGPLDRALDLLLVLAEADSPPKLSELARRLGLPKSTVHRIVGQLARRGFVDRDASLGLRLGPALARLGQASLRTDTLVQAAQPIVDEASRELGETLFVVAARDAQLVVLYKHEGTGVLRAAPALGTTVPLHATAAGRLYLAYAPTEFRPPRGPLRAFTERTPVDRQELENRVRRARERGYDENVGEWVEGLAVLAAPILGRESELHGVLTCALSESSFRALGSRGLETRLVRTAERIAARIEGRKT